MIEKIIEGVKTIKDLFKEDEVSSIEKLQLKKMKKALTFYIQIENQIEKHFNLSENFLEDCTEIQFKNLYKEILYKELKSDKALKESIAEIANRHEREKELKELRDQIFLLNIEKQNLLNQIETKEDLTNERRNYLKFIVKFIEETKRKNDGRVTIEDIVKYSLLVEEKKIEEKKNIPALFPYDVDFKIVDEDFDKIIKKEGKGKRETKEIEITKKIKNLINGSEASKYKKINGKWHYKKIGNELNIHEITIAKYLKNKI